jgi:hypothetical protein
MSNAQVKARIQYLQNMKECSLKLLSHIKGKAYTRRV